MSLNEYQFKTISEIDRFISRCLFGPGRGGELTPNEERLFNIVMDARQTISIGNDLPPLMMLEMFLLIHGQAFPIPQFVLDWLSRGALEFHQSEGKEHFERGLGFTAGRGKHSGQGHEFKKARREQIINRHSLFTWIRMLNIFADLTLDRAVGIVHEIHRRQLASSLRKRQPLSPSELYTEYRSWKGKNWNPEYEALLRERWGEHRTEWMSLIDQIESET